MGFSMNDYGLAIWSFKKPENVNNLLDTDIVLRNLKNGCRYAIIEKII